MGFVEAGIRVALSAGMALGQVSPGSADGGAKKSHDHMRHVDVIDFSGDFSPKEYLNPNANAYSTQYLVWFEGGTQNGMCGDNSDTRLHGLPVVAESKDNRDYGVTGENGSISLTGNENASIIAPQDIVIKLKNGMFVGAHQGNVSRQKDKEVCITYVPNTPNP